MGDFFKNEVTRYRGWLAAGTFVHLALLGLGNRITDMAPLSIDDYWIVAGIYVASALLFGLYQMGGYRRRNVWVNLLHRPVPRWKIATALFGAGSTLLMVAILLPLLTVAAWQEWMTPRVLDARHWWLLLSAGLISLCAYLAGGYAMLASRRHVICVVSVLLLLVMSNATGIGATVVQVFAAVWLAVLVCHAFKPDLAAPPRGPFGAVMTAIPLMSSVWLVLLFLTQVGEIAWLMQGSHPDLAGMTQANSVRQTQVAEGKDLMIAGLTAAVSGDVSSLREAAVHAEVVTIRNDILRFPERNDLTNPRAVRFVDLRRRIRWVFSHDSMRFEGIGLDDERLRGRLGVQGDQAFPFPALPYGAELLLTREAVYRYSSEALRISPLMQVPRGETIVGFHRFGERVGLLTDHALRIYGGDSPSTANGPLQPRFLMPFTGKIGALRRIDLMELPDGFLVSMTFSRRTLGGDNAPFQELARLTADGRASIVARRELVNGFSTPFRYRNWYTSPVLFAAQRWMVNLFSVYDPGREMDRQPIPRLAWIFAFGFALASLLAAAWRLQRLEMPKSGKAAWLLACAAFSVPAVVSLWLIYPPRERLDDLRRPLPALGSGTCPSPGGC